MTLLLMFLLAGAWRWPVKCGCDAAVPRTPVDSVGTIATLSDFKPPPRLGLKTPRQPRERIRWTVSAILRERKHEADGDLHLVLWDGMQTLVAEVPEPAQMARACPYRSAIASARATAAAAPIGSWVRVTGFLFFDQLHGATGAARNGAELHPVTALAVVKQP